MPYVTKASRDRLDDKINALAVAIKELSDDKTAFAGLLNYSCTRLALETLPERRYWTIAIVTGIFKNIADEFYRRFGVPYEAEQIEKNGDVYP